MPEIKNNFSQGKMNRDLDERLIPKGQYREAMNIQVSTSEGSDVGTAQNILGNSRIEDVIGGNWNCVGAISDEKNNKLYWLIHNPSRDAILEYNLDNGQTTPVLVDTNMDVLKFNGNLITGINIIDNILMWTDNVNEPKKINIERCILGTTAFNVHTKLVVDNIVTSDDLKEEHITVIKKRPSIAPSIKITQSASVLPVEATCALSQNNEGQFLAVPGDTVEVRIPRVQGSGGAYFPAIFLNIGDVLLLSQSNASGALPSNAELRGTVTGIVETIGIPGYYTYTLEVISIIGSLPVTITTFDGNNIDTGLLMNVVKQVDLSGSLFNKKFIRFATRWKYEDNEYSAFSPFTDVVFNAGRFSFHPIKNTYNLGMENNCKEIQLSNLVPPDIPRDVTQVDILFKLEDSTTIYSIDSIKPSDPIVSGQVQNNWNKTTGSIMILNPATTLVSTDLSGSYSGVYNITTENIHAALPANQLLRPWDNVPKKALAQEITGNRLVYGNYTQGYDMVDGSNIAKPLLSASYRQRSFLDTSIVNFSSGKKSLKTFKNYQIGVVYGDEQGRETPVFTSQNSSIKIPWDSDSTPFFNGNASRSTQLTARLSGDQPDFASYYKFFVKQVSGEYYNLTMDRIYRAEDEENLWLSFPSSDVNKIQEGQFIVLKKQVDLELQVPEDNRFKVIDIKSEAPDYIKYDSSPVGNIGGELAIVQDLYVGYSTGAHIPEKNNNLIEINKAVWTINGGSNLSEIDEKLELIFTKIVGGSVLQSQTYRITSVEEVNNSANYKILLNKPIAAADDWVLSNQADVTIEPTLRMKILQRLPREGNEFQGRFFVKIIVNLITKQYLESLIAQEIIYKNSTSFDSYYLADEQAAAGADSSLGVVNTTNQLRYNSASDPESITSEPKSNTEAAWNLLYEFGNDTVTPSWFVDQAYFASVQPLDSSDPSGETGSMGVGMSGRHHIGSGGPNGSYYVDSIEGIVNTTESGGAYTNVGTSVHSATNWGARHWTYQSRGSGNPYSNGVSFPTNEVDDIYVPDPNASPTETTGKHYMHISFGPLGEDLHDGTISFNSNAAIGIWQYIDPGNYVTDIASNYPNWPAVNGFTAQWHMFHQASPTSLPTFPVTDPTNPNSGILYTPKTPSQWKIQDPEMRAIAYRFRTVGTRFRFDGSEEVFTIKRFRVKRLYNHTPFMRTQNEWDGTGNVMRSPLSVQTLHKIWIDDLNNVVTNSLGTSSGNTTRRQDFLAGLKRFGSASNRRLLYILELDKDPNDYLSTSDFEFDVDTIHNIRFVEPIIRTGDTSPTVSPAIWETEIEDETDLNIYYEASDAIPLKLNEEKETSEMYAPLGSKVWCSKSGSMPTFAGVAENLELVITNWEQHTSGFYQIVEIASPGLNVDTSVVFTNTTAGLNAQTAKYLNKTLRFFKPDGSFVASSISEVIEISGDYITKLRVGTYNWNKYCGLSYYDCFSFGNGVESDRIRDDFNAMTIGKGVKASAVLEEEYKEENRKSGLIYSGIYNSTSGVNNLNQFIQAEKITKDLNPTYGSIQKLFQRRIDLVTFCEDKVVKILSNKDALYNADGNSQLVATNRVLGDANPFVGDFGISKNPESFAKESYRAYFTDKQRGAVLRLSMDGLTPISDAGMRDYFKDSLRASNNLLGSYDSYKDDYNLTLDNVTISYDERSKGWSSFKSFVPEFGLSCSNGYYTFDQGMLYKHHLTTSPIDGSSIDRNTFYATNNPHNGSEVEPSVVISVLNDKADFIKSFNTINYEGDAGWTNAVITTDQQSGTIAEFIEKEGKWFNYIRGQENNIDLQAFNFQGIGQTIGIEYNV
jgi:hypothetical protein